MFDQAMMDGMGESRGRDGHQDGDGVQRECRGNQVFQAVTARARQIILVILFGEALRGATTGPRSDAGERRAS